MRLHPRAGTSGFRVTEAVQAPGGVEIQAEYPVCMAGPGGTLLAGFIDLLAVQDGEVVVSNSSRVMPNCSATSARTLASVPIRSTPWAGTVT